MPCFPLTCFSPKVSWNSRLTGIDRCSVHYPDCQVERMGRKPYTVTPCIRGEASWTGYQVAKANAGTEVSTNRKSCRDEVLWLRLPHLRMDGLIVYFLGFASHMIPLAATYGSMKAVSVRLCSNKALFIKLGGGPDLVAGNSFQISILDNPWVAFTFLWHWKMSCPLFCLVSVKSV